jgi:hypothetical protein
MPWSSRTAGKKLTFTFKRQVGWMIGRSRRSSAGQQAVFAGVAAVTFLSYATRVAAAVTKLSATDDDDYGDEDSSRLHQTIIRKLE